MGMSELDLLGSTMTHDPHDQWARVRREEPIRWDEQQKAWLLSTYADVVAGFTDPRLSSDRINPLLAVLKEERRATVAPMLSVMRNWMVVTDPPAHTRLRRLANAAFRQQRIANMKVWIGEIVDDILDEFVAKSGSDFVAGVAYPMPASVIGRMIGAPSGDRDLFQRWSDELALAVFGAGGEDRADRHTRALKGVLEMQEYLRGVVADRRSTPGDDMISYLLAESNDGDRLSEDELISLCSLILFAGHETTTNLLCNAVVVLDRHRDQLDTLRQQAELVAPAIEEVLRFEGPIKVLVRWVAEDLVLRDRQLRAGDRVYLVLQSANRDSEIFSDADRFDIQRPTQPTHVGFGRGAHACIGAQLARLEARVALPKILDRLPALSLTHDVSWKPAVSSRAVSKLTVSYGTTQPKKREANQETGDAPWPK
jgi:cytochrome P450